jgi:hypothetical protein
MDAKTNLEDLMFKMEDWLEEGHKIFREMNALSECHQDNEYREIQEDYERSIAC